MTGIIILAAGRSSRMGQPKQLLYINETTLLQHAINSAVASDADVVLVVLGYRSDDLRPAEQHAKINLVVNEDWQSGMGSSISTGIKKMIALNPLLDNVLIMLCDQPLVSSGLLNELIQKRVSTDRGIIACSYAGTVGVPVIFSDQYFEYLATLRGETGAKKILLQFADDIALINFPGGKIDIDTPEDLEKLSCGS